MASTQCLARYNFGRVDPTRRLRRNDRHRRPPGRRAHLAAIVGAAHATDSGTTSHIPAAQRLYYFPLRQPDEAVVFRLADSDHSVPRLAAHTAFAEPTTPADAAPRQSIEVGRLAFFD